ncbi:MAG: glycosyltransferase family 2 protein [Lachnospiraceae bacterium]|nr:glycosyltransferase family 2 protein [Lachnospiraceae bacterium]
MKQIVYSKFSNERARELAIRTDIYQEDNIRKVYKRPLYEEGKAHVAKLPEWEEKLSKKYENTCISFNHGTKEGDAVFFEYLEGDTLESLLDEYLAAEKYEQLIDLLRQYIEKIRQANGEKGFVVTEQFEKVFGKINSAQNLSASDINNIDMVVGNVIIDQNRWNVIDYEWTFDFPIPTNFIIYRVVFYYVNAQKREDLKKIDLYKIFGITDKEKEMYWEMEQHFQRYIISGITPIRDMYAGISKGTVRLEEILKISASLEEEKRMQVYFDKGNGYSEAESEWHYEMGNNGEVRKIALKLCPETIGLRIDPAEQPCIVKFHKIIGKADFTYKMEFETNAYKVDKNTYLFLDPDPWVSISNFRPGTTEVVIEIQKEFLDQASAESLLLVLDKNLLQAQNAVNESKALREENIRIPDLEAEIGALHRQNADLNHRLYLAESSFHEIQGSLCWKITKPIRIAGSVVRLFFRKHFRLKCFLKNVKRFITMGPKKMEQFNAEERIQKRSFHVRDEISVICNEQELQAQRGHQFKNPRKFSIVVPLYNTPELYLRKMIESALSQTYENLELCLVDASDKKHSFVKDICKEYCYYDARIVYKKLKKNMGIADNTNVALQISTGDYIVLFDHDDFLHPSALFEVMKAIEEKGADFVYTDENTFHETIDDAYQPHFKPDFSPDYLRAINYICHLTAFSRELYEHVGGFRREFDGSQDYDMILRLTEEAEQIVHIPKILYFWRAHSASVAMDINAKRYCLDSAKKALEEHLNRIGLDGVVEDNTYDSSYRIRYQLQGMPLVSILIPNKDHVKDLRRCLESIREKTTYKNYEIIIVENNSEQEETFAYYKELENAEDIRVVIWEDEFNYSAINNYGATFAKGEYLLLLNNDMEVITPEWLEEMLMFVQREDVGAAGAKLYYANDTIQHAGAILGIGGVAGHSHKYFPKNEPGYFFRLAVAQNLSAVTAACLMIKKSLFDDLGGLDEQYRVAFNDIDLCVRIRKKGYLIVFTPYAELYHYESISRGAEDTPEKVKRFNGEVDRFKSKWGKELEDGDPYYNPNLTLVYEDFRVAK